MSQAFRSVVLPGRSPAWASPCRSNAAWIDEQNRIGNQHDGGTDLDHEARRPMASVSLPGHDQPVSLRRFAGQSPKIRRGIRKPSRSNKARRQRSRGLPSASAAYSAGRYRFLDLAGIKSRRYSIRQEPRPDRTTSWRKGSLRASLDGIARSALPRTQPRRTRVCRAEASTARNTNGHCARTVAPIRRDGERSSMVGRPLFQVLGRTARRRRRTAGKPASTTCRQCQTF